MTTTEALLDRLKGGGYRSTASRRHLLDVLVSRGEGFTAEEIVAAVPRVGRATVYRTIRLLVEEGLVCKLPMDSGAPRYAVAQVEHHHHVVCVRCGAVREFSARDMERLLNDLETAAGDAVVGHRIEVFVVCANCRAAA